MQNIQKARELMIEGMREMLSGHAKIKRAHDDFLWKGKGEGPKAPSSNSNGNQRTPYTPPEDRVYVNSNDIPSMFDFLLENMPDTDQDKVIIRRIYGDFRAYKRLTDKQYYRIKHTYYSYQGPDLHD